MGMILFPAIPTKRFGAYKALNYNRNRPPV